MTLAEATGEPAEAPVEGRTPGPWRLADSYATHVAYEDGDGDLIALAGRARASRSDMQLMAAAPDLLAALQKVLDLAATGNPRPAWSLLNEIWVEADVAIRKTRGPP